jgi:uncharacterized protein (PEP-CTERM system associated)
LRHKTYEMPAKPRRSLRRYGAVSAALAASLLGAPCTYAQEPTRTAAADGPAQAAGDAQAPRSSGSGGGSSFVESLIPGLELSAAVNLSETYATNARGISGAASSSRPDYITRAGINTNLHEHSRRVSLDANYTGAVDYYAQGSQSTQFTNYLQAFGDVIAVPDYLNFFGRAFAQPVILSNSGIVTANGSVAPNGFRNSYGFSAGPDITFRLGDFASSDTTATYGATYFTNPAGQSSSVVIPGLAGPQDTVMRTVTEKLSSGADFSRLSWSLAGAFSEIDRAQGLLSEKAGVGQFRYAITREISLLGTGGYDAISNTTPLTKDVTGPVALGGFALTFGEDFYLEVQVGEKYNSASYQGLLRWNLSPTAILSGSATDSVSTPEGQLLNNLSNLTATPNGTLTSSANIYANGSAASMGGFNAQGGGNSLFNQNIARYQRLNLSFSEDFQRDHASISVFGNRVTYLSGFFIGAQSVNSWGTQASVSHNLTPLLTGTIGGTYSNDQQFGGNASTFMVDGQLNYSLSPETSVYFRTDYLNRQSSAALRALSPFTGSLEDVRVTVGLSHTL